MLYSVGVFLPFCVKSGKDEVFSRIRGPPFNLKFCNSNLNGGIKLSIYYIENENGDYFSTDRKRRFIRLSGKEAYKYLKSKEGSGKRFYRLNAEDEREENIFVEVPSSIVSVIRKDERRNLYISDCKKESGLIETSLYAVEESERGERCTGEELISDTATDVEGEAIHKIQIEKLYEARTG